MRTGLGILAICGLGARGWGQVRPANYEDDVKAIFARRCLGCHNAGEMRAGLNLESFAGVLKGGGSGDAVIAGRASGSLLYRAVAREDGAPQMPLGKAKLPDAEISTIREWIQQGLLETAVSTARGAAALSLEYKPGDWNRAGGPAAMPESLAAVTASILNPHCQVLPLSCDHSNCAFATLRTHRYRTPPTIRIPLAFGLFTPPPVRSPSECKFAPR